ncbi:MAG: phosphate ABC transporter permease PstA [Bacteroidota bacterium]|nr:phosphate ABC transporter permease PstA [Bacteroidota bacterium]
MRKKIFGGSVVFVSALAAFVIIFMVILMLGALFIGGSEKLTWEFLTTAPSDGMMSGGIFPAIIGTILLVLVMSVLGVPIGTLTAIYLTEYSNQRSFFSRTIQFAVNTLAGVPAIVFGLFGLGFFVQFVGGGMDKLFSGDGQLKWAQPNLLWASFTMAFLTLPVVIVSVVEALRAIPNELREASLALGATKWQTIYKVVVPNSLNGILTGAILAVGRGAGEVAPILFTGVAYYLPHLPGSLSDQFMNLGYHVYVMTTQSHDVEATLGIQYATTLVLLVLTFTLNFSAMFLRYKIRKRAIH